MPPGKNPRRAGIFSGRHRRRAPVILPNASKTRSELAPRRRMAHAPRPCTQIEAEVVQGIAQQTLSASKRDTVMTLAERLHRKGLMEGKLEGRQSVLQRQLAKRFGDSVLDIRMQERLRSATPEELDTWAERILDAATIDDIFTDSETD